ncbi:hypothetical protein LSUB1_G005490 [Lachnellula subtilissima]|uniref:Protein ILM1 n=1 Tax=Lachnellula subtilissima TaxID=602034 RepID=A0A8H8RJK2_9HELO|nr:hypothetical protein LSUB1_G005490 [Lachnellula subtilissima]
MALISAATIITSLSLFHMTLAFFFLTNPHQIADQTLVFILGEAMGLPESRTFETQSAPLAFLAAVLLFLGVSDLVACSLPEEIYSYFWGSQSNIPISFPPPHTPSPSPSNILVYCTPTNPPTPAPARLVLLFAYTFYSFFFSAKSPMYSNTPQIYTASSWGEGLKNRVFFTWAFVEMITWFWVFVTLREERRDVAIRAQERMAAEADRL